MNIEIENLINVEKLVFEYRRNEEEISIRAIDNVSMQIKKGSFTAIIGRNGSGKSTLAKNLNALLLPTGGTVIVDGLNTSDSDNVWNIRQTVGMVFQNPDNQIVSSIVEDDVAFGPENLGIESQEIRQRVDESLAAVDMFEERKKAPHLLSGGQKQRIAIAGVIAMKPECIIFDEPTAMLDPKGREDVLKIINQLNKEEGKTIILITHFMEEAAEADRIIIMDEGIIKMDGTPREIFQRTDELIDYGLTVPFAAELAQRLRGEGMEIPKSIITTKEMVDYLCQ